MCWQSLLPEEHLAPKIATDNFSVYKVLRKNGKTPVMEYPIKFNEPLPKVDVSPQTSEFIVNIEKGYHSYVFNLDSYDEVLFRKKLIVNTDIGLYSFSMKITMDVHEAYIPKGTQYWLNERGEIVSESLVITEKTIEPQRYKNPLTKMMVMRNNNPELFEVPYNEIEETENILGIVFLEDNLSSKVWFVSMMKEDWIPKTIEEYSKCSSMPNKCQKSTLRFNCFDSDRIAQIYRYAEIINGNVDWSQPYYPLVGKKFLSLYTGIYSEKNDKGYCIPIYCCKMQTEYPLLFC